MSTAEQKTRNREKQKRFQQRHPGYNARLAKERQERQELINPKPIIPTSDYRTYEICDPRNLEKLPVIVGYCHATKPVWADLWSVRHYSKSKWAAWMRKLEALGLEPEERETPWNVGVNFGVNRIIAEFAVQSRIKRICNIMGDPDFLLRHLFGRSQYPVGYVTAGEVFHFPTIKAASEATGVHQNQIKGYVSEVREVKEKRWFDD